MTNRSDMYSKGDGSRIPIEREKDENVDGVAIPLTAVAKTGYPPEGYYKTDAELDLFSFFVIVSGGIRREKDYFSYIMDHPEDFRNIRISFVAEDNETGEEGLCPLKMYEVALRKKRGYAETEGEKPDRIALVVDVDDFRDKILFIKPQCEAHSMGLYISNCCFEIWLYYGHFGIKPVAFPEVEPHKRSQTMKKYLNEKVSGGVKPNKEIRRIEIAMENSKKNYEEDEKEIPKLFSTSLHLLAKDILPFIKEGLATWVKLEKEKREMYKKNKI